MARQIIGPDVSFYQDDPGTPQEINFERMTLTTDFVIIRAGQNLWVDSDFRNNWRRSKEAGLPRLLNTPVNENTPKRERAVANHIGISLRK